MNENTELTGKKQEKVDKRKSLPQLFKKGQSGNLDGRPKGTISALTQLKKHFRENPEDFEEYLERYRNNPQNEKHIMEMMDGKPKQSHEIEMEQPIIVVPQSMIDRFNISKPDDGTDT